MAKGMCINDWANQVKKSIKNGNYAKFLKNLHDEQIKKLLLKNQHECDLLEDIRSYTLKKCAIEKSYSDALLKISSAYLNKKIPNIPDIKLEGGEEKWNMWNVWRTVLEENEKLARARLAAVEVFQTQIAEDSKLLKAHKVQTARKCVDHLANVQKELQNCVQDIDKTKKLYFDEEHSAHDVRDKARDIEEKLKKKKGSFFQSITSLQKNSAKFSSKREQLEEKSAGARNDYLLCLAAANAHQTRYFVVDLQQCMTALESGVYEKVAEYLTLMGRTELLTCSAMQNSYSTIRDQAKQLTREYNLQCCYLYYPVLKQHIQYDFEPCDNDPITTILAEHDNAASTLNKEARRWATRIAREDNNIKECTKKMQIYQALRDSGQRVDPQDQNGPDLETKIEDMRQQIRKSETSKAKAEARIECLRAGGVNVDEWLQEAEMLNVQDIQRSTSSLSDHPSSDSFYDSDFAETEAPAPQPVSQPMVEHADSEDSQAETAEVDGEWAMLENERQRIEQLTAGWDDPTQVDWGTEDASAVEDNSSDIQRDSIVSSSSLLKCTALYSYTAQNPDELTIIENEQLEVVGEGDGDGWLKARNYRGEEGYVPHNYLDVEREQLPTNPGLVNQISFSSVDYTIDQEEEMTAQSGTTTNQSPEQISVISIPAADASPNQPLSMTERQDTLPPTYCIALYDYDGEGSEELTFEEGQIIRVLSKCAHSVDDGWWQGELEGRIGNFPSLVVEECDEFGEPMSNELDQSPPPSAPPVFTPPGAPPGEFNEYFSDEPELPPPAEQPPPPPPDILEEVADFNPATSSRNSNNFSMELSRNQQEHYVSQFDETEENNIPAIEIPSLAVEDEDPQEANNEAKYSSGDFGLGVAQIVITAATPMIEEPESAFPPVEEEEEEEKGNVEEENAEEKLPEEETPPEPEEDDRSQPPKQSRVDSMDEIDETPADSAPFAISSSTGSDGDTTGPSTAENSISQVPPPLVTDVEPKQVVGGRASIPDELEPHQLARLQDLKESNA
ncbi:protein nervous wreck isoform X3 [Coccinella septempunctata]|uniref:protein nervous wreck isoform X3 n=1 Tax=Coccinella septempunctata TaxID=41139 RepID=UPI001D086005|nr:protein nervous wreck isoform X3 [Coccinella septempunctata]